MRNETVVPEFGPTIAERQSRAPIEQLRFFEENCGMAGLKPEHLYQDMKGKDGKWMRLIGAAPCHERDTLDWRTSIKIIFYYHEKPMGTWTVVEQSELGKNEFNNPMLVDFREQQGETGELPIIQGPYTQRQAYIHLQGQRVQPLEEQIAHWERNLRIERKKKRPSPATESTWAPYLERLKLALAQFQRTSKPEWAVYVKPKRTKKA